MSNTRRALLQQIRQEAPVRCQFLVEFDSFDLTGELTGMNPIERLKATIETHPTLSFMLENVEELRPTTILDPWRDNEGLEVLIRER